MSNPSPRYRQHPVKFALACGGFLNLLLGGLCLVFLFDRDIDSRIRSVRVLHFCVMLLGILVPSVLAVIVLRRRRAIHLYLMDSVCFAVLAWHMSLLGFFCFVVGTESGAQGALVYAVTVVFVTALLLVFLEWRVVPGIWRKATQCGRIDLERGVLRPAIWLPESPRSTRIGAALGSLGLVAILLGIFLRRMIGMHSAMVVGMLACFAGGLLIAGVAWVHGFACFLRLLRWEWTEKRKVIIQ